jgi:hypothetical protein
MTLRGRCLRFLAGNLEASRSCLPSSASAERHPTGDGRQIPPESLADFDTRALPRPEACGTASGEQCAAGFSVISDWFARGPDPAFEEPAQDMPTV